MMFPHGADDRKRQRQPAAPATDPTPGGHPRPAEVHDRPDIAPLALARALLFRLLTYGLEIPLGAITYLIWQRKKSWRKPLHPTAPAAVPAPPA
jgi:hypothetical protein